MRAALAALLFLAACSGGSTTGTITPVGQLRTDLKYGYWSGDPQFMLEQADHVNLWWALDDTALVWHLAIAAQLQQARGAGIKNIVIHLPTTDPAELRFQLGKLSDGGYLSGWDSITLYPLDEPERFGMTDAQVSDAVTKVKQVAFDTPGLIFAKVGVFYGCLTSERPGIKSFDLVGCFHYEPDGCAKLESDYAALRSQLAIGSRLWLIPGGATIGGKNGRQDPACWASYAHRNPDVWGIIAFLWQSVPGTPLLVGIRVNGMRPFYCQTGRTILGSSKAC